MKYITFLLVVLFYTSCNDIKLTKNSIASPENSKNVTVKLIDSLGYVTCSIPNRYDTFLYWTNWSDCGKPCAKEQYRFQPKYLRITKETGFIWLGEPKDSIERFTIVHSGYFPFHDSVDSLFIFNFHEQEKSNIIYDPGTYRIKSDTIEKIGDRFFSIIEIDLYDTTKAQYSKKLLAATTIKRNIIHFDFELLTKQKDAATDNFINNSKYYLRTIRISNGK